MSGSGDLSRSRAICRSDLLWTAQNDGSRYSLLHMTPDGGVITVTQFDAGAVGGWHDHPGGEQLYMLSGCIRIDGHELRAGDFLMTPPGTRHRVEAIDDSELLVILPKLPIYD